MKYDIFISYSRKDIEVATKICAVLNEYKKFYDFKYFFDISEIGSSAAYLKKIATAIDSSRAVLFVASKDSCKSEFCSKELLFADKRGVRIHQYRIDNSDVPLDLDILLGTHQYREMSTTPIECEVQEVLSDVLGYDVLPLAELKSSNQVVDSCDAEKVDRDDVATASAADDTTSDKLSKGGSKNDDGVIGRLLAAFRGLFAFCFKAIKTIAVVLGVVFVFICFDAICDDEADDTDMEADGKIDPNAAAKDGLSNNEEDVLFEDLKKDEQQPSAEESAQDASAVYHVIESGDTFSLLAVKYETTKAKIEELNPGVDSRKIRLGQKIRVK